MSSPWAVTGALPWAPPTLTNPRLVTLGDTTATRQITLNAGEDCLISAPNVLTDYSMVGWQDALVQVIGGRNVVWVGGHICAARSARTVLTAPIASTDVAGATITVASTAGFPSPKGAVRIDGEQLLYDGLTATTLTIAQRNNGFFNNTPASSKTTHDVGATVYVNEATRAAVSFKQQTGTVHLEGLQLDGFINDGIRASAAASGTLQVQNCRIGPVTNYDLANETDGHPDCFQTYQGGFGTIKIGRSTLLTGPNGNAILNQGVSPQVGAFTLKDMDIKSGGFHRSLVVNDDSGTAWTVDNAWLRAIGTPPASLGFPMLNDKGTQLSTALSYQQIAPGEVDTVPASMLANYVSPGYL